MNRKLIKFDKTLIKKESLKVAIDGIKEVIAGFYEDAGL